MKIPPAKNPYSDKRGNPLPGKFKEWVQWKNDNQNLFKDILTLPIEERRYKAVRDENRQCRMNSESGIFYDDNQRQMHILKYLTDYQAVERDMSRAVCNPYGDVNDGPQLGQHWEWINWEQDFYSKRPTNE